MDHILFLTVYLSLFFSLFICLFLYILAVPEWQKYLECESLCSSCTRTEIIAMIIKKNMTKLYMHHFRGGLVYCCIVTYEKIFCFLRKEKKKHGFCFVPRVQYVLSFLCLYHYLICLICNLTFTEREKKRKKKKRGFICQYLKFLQKACNSFPSVVPHFLHVSALCTAHRYEYSTPMHK